MEFDDILKAIGECGKYQIFLYILLGLVGIPTGWQNLAMVFIGGYQDHWCTGNGGILKDAANLAEQNHTLDEKMLQCRSYDWNSTDVFNTSVDWEREGEKCTDWTYDTSQYTSTIRNQWDLVCDNEYLVALASTIYMAGFLTGAIGFGSLSDLIGRKKSLLICLFVELVAAVAAAVVSKYGTYGLFVALRFVVGNAAGGSFTVAFVMVMEVVGGPWRMYLGIFVQGWFALGFLSEPLLAFFIRDHFVLQLSLALPVALLLTYFWLVPESPRWLVAENRAEEAEPILRNIAKHNNRSYPEMDEIKVMGSGEHYNIAESQVSANCFFEKNLNFEEAEPIIRNIAKENSRSYPEDKYEIQVLESGDTYNSGESQISKDDATEHHDKATLLDILRRPRMRLRLFITFFIWFVNSLVYYGISYNADKLGGSIYVNSAITAAVEIPAYFLTCFCLNKVGRRWMLVATMIGGGAALVVQIPALNNTDLNWLVVVLANVGKFGISASFAIIYVFTAELFPTVVRNAAVGSGSMCARIGGLLAPQIIRLDTIIWFAFPSLVMGGFSVAAGLLSLFLPETSGERLPETLEDGEEFGTKAYRERHGCTNDNEKQKYMVEGSLEDETQFGPTGMYNKLDNMAMNDDKVVERC